MAQHNLPDNGSAKCECGHTSAQHQFGSLSCKIETCICFLFVPAEDDSAQ